MSVFLIKTQALMIQKLKMVQTTAVRISWICCFTGNAVRSSYPTNRNYITKL